MRLFEINGDKKLNFPKKIFLMIQIFFDITKESKINRNYKNQIRLKTKDINYTLVNSLDKKIISPLRIASLHFLINYFSEYEKTTINIVDFGCGSGRYYKWLDSLNININNYLGIDISYHKNWELLKSKNVNFIDKEIKKSSNLKIDFKPDLIFSTFCLEHVKNDFEVIREFKNLFPRVKQLHIVPASISGINYLGHGHRRYNFREIESFLKKNNYNFKIAFIGNKSCFEDYFSYYSKVKKNRHLFSFAFKKIISKEYNPDIDYHKYIKLVHNEYPMAYAVEIN